MESVNNAIDRTTRLLQEEMLLEPVNMIPSIISDQPSPGINLLKINEEREKRIKELKEIDPKSNASIIAELLSKLRTDYKNILINYPLFAMKEKKDIDALLWKNCFYKQIEDFRRSVRKNSSTLGNMTAANDPLVEKQKFLIAKIVSAFITFLADSSTFYQDMMLELESRLFNTKHYPRDDKEATMIIEGITKCICRCLLYLGDLARELYTDRAVKDFSAAEKYYERASIIIPTSGNAHNQLAVLATYNEAEFEAVYYYCRSILVQNPFSGGFDNLLTLFNKNISVFSSLKKQQKDNNDRNKKSENKLKNFQTKFIRLHGILFDWSVEIHRYHVQLDANPNRYSQSTISYLEDKKDSYIPNSRDLNVEEYTKLLQSVLEEYDQQIEMIAFSDVLLLKSLTICLFSIHHSAMKDNNILLNLVTHNKNPITSRTRSIPESLALITLFGIINRTATKINNVMCSSDKAKFSFLNRLLPMLSVFSEWATANSHYMETFEENKESSQTLESSLLVLPSILSSVTEKYDADRDLLRSEVRARSGMRASLSSLIDILEEDIERNDIGISEINNARNHYLKEHIDLRGFLPLVECYEAKFYNFDPINKSITYMSEPCARFHRENAVLMFTNNILLAIANKESQDSAIRQQQLKEKMDAAKESAKKVNNKDNNNNNSNRNKSREDLHSLDKSGKHHQRRGRDESNNNNRAKTPPKPKRGPPAQNTDDLIANSNNVDLSFQEFPPLPGHNGLPRVNNSEFSLDIYESNQNEINNDELNPEADPVFNANDLKMDVDFNQNLFSPSNNNNNMQQFNYFNSNNNSNSRLDGLGNDNTDLVNGLFLGDDDIDDVVVFKPTFSRLANNNNNQLKSVNSFSNNSISDNIFSNLGNDNNFMFLQENNNISNNINNFSKDPWSLGIASNMNSYGASNVSNNLNNDNGKSEKKLSDLFRSDSFQDYWNDLSSTNNNNNNDNNNNNNNNNNNVPLINDHYNQNQFFNDGQFSASLNNNSNSNNLFSSVSAPLPPPGLQSVPKPPGLSSSNTDLSYMERKYQN